MEEKMRLGTELLEEYPELDLDYQSIKRLLLPVAENRAFDAVCDAYALGIAVGYAIKNGNKHLK